MITLTDDERKKFAEYLLQEVNTANTLIVQMQKLNLPENVLAINRQFLVACMIVHKQLVNVEVQTISTEGQTLSMTEKKNITQTKRNE